MKLKHYLFSVPFVVAIAIVVYACGSSNSSFTPRPIPTTAPTAVPIAKATPFTSVTKVVVAPAAPTAVPLPVVPGYSGSIDLGTATTLPPGTTVSNTLTNVAPTVANLPALSDVLRNPIGKRGTASANGAIVVLAYIDVLYSNPVTYATEPSFGLTVPSADITTASYRVAAYDPTRPSLGWQLGFESGTVSGSTLAFSGANTPYTFAANANYYFGVYAISASAATPTPAPSIAPIAPTTAPPTAAPTVAPSPTAAPTVAPSPTATPFIP